MKDFTFWHSAIYNAKTALVLKAVGEDLNNFQNQSDFLNEGYKLKEAEVAILRKHYSEKMNGFDSLRSVPAGKLKPPDKPKFNK